MKQRIALLLIGLCLSLPSAMAQTAQEQLASRYRALDVIMDLRLERESVPGAAFGVVHDQDLIWSYQYGVESLKTKRRVTNDTAFSICSVSKLFNGVAAMALVERDQLALDQSIFDYLGDIAPADNTGSDEPATLRNLLSHVSGLPREGVEDFWADTRFPDSATLRASSEAHDQLYQPYEHWQYSNLGMALIGEAIAEVTKQPWGTFIEQTILEPLGMENTTTDMPFDRVGKGFARGYYVRNSKGQRKPVEEHQFKAYAPAAGIASSVNDMAKFAAWNFRLRETGAREILNAATLKQMQRVHWVGPEFDDPAWGLAFATRRADGDTLWGHGGYCPGARTQFVMRLPDQTAYLMMLTANDVSPAAFVAMAYDFLNAKIVAAHDDDKEKNASDADVAEASDAEEGVDLSEYEGHYATENYDWDSYIGLDDGALFSIAIYGSNVVKNMEKLIHKEGDVFYRERDDGSEGERVIFEREKSGKIVSVTQHSYRSMKQ